MAETKQDSKWQQFRKSRMGLVFGMVLAALLALVILLYGGFISCLPTILAALVIYFVPKYFGLVNRKKLVVVALAMMLFLGLAMSFTVNSIVNDLKPREATSSNGIMSQGQVAPFRGTSASSYDFSVAVEGANASSEVWVEAYGVVFYGVYAYPVAVERINLTLSSELDSETRLFHMEKQMADNVYALVFYYINGTGAEIHTSTTWGPVAQDLLAKVLSDNMLYVFLNVGLWFCFILLGSWYFESSKKRMAEVQKQRRAAAEPAKGRQEKFVCSECGADVPGDAKECPQCGERFDEEEGAVAKCPACGKEQGPNSTSCWNCGKDLRK